jgi:hypothetical protein
MDEILGRNLFSNPSKRFEADANKSLEFFYANLRKVFAPKKFRTKTWHESWRSCAFGAF